MTYFFWGLLNVVIFVSFLSICFRAAKLVKQNFGVLAVVVFVFGLLSFAGQPYQKNEGEVKKWPFSSAALLQPNSSYSAFAELEKTWVSTIGLFVDYSKSKEGDYNIPTSAYTNMTGFISGTAWKPILVHVKPTANSDVFRYEVTGIMEWMLLGTTLYSQHKVFTSTVSVLPKP